jgi:hypothetical protein
MMDHKSWKTFEINKEISCPSQKWQKNQEKMNAKIFRIQKCPLLNNNPKFMI